MATHTLKEKDANTEKLIMFILTLAALLVISIVVLHHLKPIKYEIPFLAELGSKLLFIKAIFLVVIFGFAFVHPGMNTRTKLANANVIFYLLYTSIAMIFFIIPIKGNLITTYFLVGANVIAVFALPYLVIATTSLLFQKKSTEPEEQLKQVNTKSLDEYSFRYETQKGPLVVPNPFQGMLVEGGAGSGKSASIIETTIYQALEKGFSGFIYDFKGSPPTLGKTAYNSCKQLNSKSRFAIINFSDLKNSNRCNPINPAYLKTASHCEEAAIVLMRNLNPEYIERPDFWARNYQTVLKGCIMFLQHIEQTTGRRVCTLPHLVTLLLEDFQAISERVNQNDQLRKMTSAVFGIDPQAVNQLQGVKGTIQSAINRLYTKELFYILNPSKEDEISLDVSNPADPIMLTVCNDPEIPDALGPAVSLIASRVMKLINQQGKNPSLFCIDELPTLYIPNLATLPATGRSNKVVTLLGIQDMSQLQFLYKDEAKMVLANMGTQFVGMTNNTETAKRVVDLLGQVRKEEVSRTESDSSTSESFRQHTENIVLNSQISGQRTGHFTGKIANGQPPQFHVQFKQFSDLKMDEPVKFQNTISDDDLRFKLDENWETIENDIRMILNNDDIQWLED